MDAELTAGGWPDLDRAAGGGDPFSHADGAVSSSRSNWSVGVDVVEDLDAQRLALVGESQGGSMMAAVAMGVGQGFLDDPVGGEADRRRHRSRRACGVPFGLE